MRRFAVTTAVLLAGGAGAFGVPVEWSVGAGGNGHYYEFVYLPNVTWSNANAAARGLTFNGVHGYLATLTSAGENAFLAGAFPERWGSDQNGWLGGYQDTGAADFAEPAGGWRWVTGEAWSYTNWFTLGPVEPDNAGGSQNYLRSNVNNQWDDYQNDPANPSIQYISGYFVEYAVPEPMGIPVVAGGVLVISQRMRRRIKVPLTAR